MSDKAASLHAGEVVEAMVPDWIGRAQEFRPCVRDFVGGRWKPQGAGDMIAKYCPRDGHLLYQFAAAQPQDVDGAVTAASQAFEDGRWSRMPVDRRKDVLHKLASLIELHKEELALLESLDAGKPIGAALDFDVPTAAAVIRFNAEASDKSYGKVYGVDQSSLSYQLRRPFGVIAGIVGWNFPLLLATSKIGPALAVGNSLVLKPSELTSLSAARVAELAVEAGVPEGVLNVIHGAADVGAALALHSGVDLLTFTGSTSTGKKLLIAAGRSNMKRLVLECGGKSPNIVFEDCPDPGQVADGIVARAFYNQGQVCTASSRLLVQHGIKSALMALVLERVPAWCPGDPLDPRTRFGALVSDAHRKKVIQYVESGIREGATTVYRGKDPYPHPDGFYMSPVVFDDVTPDSQIATEEIFGPVLSVVAFRDEAEAIRIANKTIYGLSAILWTKDLGRAHRVTQGIRSGWITVNATGRPTGGLGVGALSVGGHKQSGMGAEGGLEGLEHYMAKTAVQWFV